MKIVKSFCHKTNFQIENESHVVSYVSFERLKPHIEEAVGLKPHEKIEGIVVDEDGINVKIGQKK